MHFLDHFLEKFALFVINKNTFLNLSTISKPKIVEMCKISQHFTAYVPSLAKSFKVRKKNPVATIHSFLHIEFE